MKKILNIDPANIRISKQILKIVPASFAIRRKVLPVALENDTLFILMPEPINFDAIDQLEMLTNKRIRPVSTDKEEELDTSIKRYYAGESSSSLTSESGEILFKSILSRALQMKSSDIHISPTENGGVIKFRLDGKMYTDETLKKNNINELISCVKVKAGLDIAEKRIPMDGNLTYISEGEEVNLRIATIPTIYGEHMTLRILSKNIIHGLDNLASLGMNKKHLSIYQKAVNSQSGIILISGPTGSGKTTTLYASLRRLAADGTKHIISIEDPVEMPIHGVTQIKIDADDNRVSFTKALKSILRHDPDVMMIGEIRDPETADIAIKSALTGHLVLSTIHTNSAPGILTRLINLGIRPFLIAMTLKIAVAQRLVRRPCQFCVQWETPSNEIKDFLSNYINIDTNIKLPVPKGCSFCAGTGYIGRTALYEMLPIDETVKNFISNGAGELELTRIMREEKQLPSLWQDGIEKMLKGITTFEEITNICSPI